MADQYDLIVIGGGPGGYVAAIRAAQLGFKTALVEQADLGGVCLNWGCIPTKTLLRGAEVAHTLRHAEQFGFTVQGVQFDIGKLVKHSRSVAERLSQGIAYLMKKHGIAVLQGHARVSAKCELTIEHEGNSAVYRADHIVLATGARARQLSALPIDGTLIWGAREAMTPEALPRRLLVVGAGAIGVEFASLYSDLGSEVTLVEALERILPVEDAEISTLAHEAFSARGIRIHTGTRVETAQMRGGEVTALLIDKQGKEQSITVDRVIVAVGIIGNIEDLGLEALGVTTARGFIQTDAFGATNVVGLYAVGDVAGPPWLAHKASHEAVLCVEHIAGRAVKPLRRDTIPGCTYCRPQIASIGLTEAAAIAAGHSVRVGRFRFNANGKALAIDDAHGLVKTIFDERTGELLGAHMIGPEVTEQIQGFGIARTLEATEAELMHTVFAHPTLSEAMHESVLDAFGRALHQ
jgi:dihydrolipoamide dehydrogenase